PANPLYLLIVRAYRLPKTVTIDNTSAYAGCKSWVPLDAPISIANAAAALDDDQFEKERRKIIDHVG
ncbi:MAG TPA: DUF1802 family protein, partial [Tepidisphaeraceae bacterium]